MYQICLVVYTAVFLLVRFCFSVRSAQVSECFRLFQQSAHNRFLPLSNSTSKALAYYFTVSIGFLCLGSCQAEVRLLSGWWFSPGAQSPLPCFYCVCSSVLPIFLTVVRPRLCYTLWSHHIVLSVVIAAFQTSQPSAFCLSWFWRALLALFIHQVI